MPMPDRNPMMGGGMPPQQPQPGMAMPTGQMQGDQPIERAQAQPVPPQGQGGGMPVTLQALATTIDRANPGLRQSNPRAFAQAVQIGMQQLQAMQGQQQETALNQAKIQELESQAEMQRAHGQYYGGKAKTAAVADKALNTMYTQNEAAIRHLETQKTKILTAFDISKAEKKMLSSELDRQLEGYKARRDMLVKQMKGESTTETKAPSEAAPPPVAIKISDANIAKLKALPPDELTKLFTSWEQKGASKEALAQLARMLRGE